MEMIIEVNEGQAESIAERFCLDCGNEALIEHFNFVTEQMVERDDGENGMEEEIQTLIIRHAEDPNLWGPAHWSCMVKCVVAGDLCQDKQMVMQEMVNNYMAIGYSKDMLASAIEECADNYVNNKKAEEAKEKEAMSEATETQANPVTLTITNLQVYPVREPKGKLRAFARVLLNDQLQITGLKLYDGTNGLFLSYPNDPNHKGEDYRQLFYPVTRELRDAIENAVIAEYQLAERS